MRAVADTNVIVSAVLSKGSPPDLILQHWRRGTFQLVTSAPLLRELDDVLGRPEIARRHKWSPNERAAFVVSLSESAIVVAPEKQLDVIAEDPDDNRVLEAAVEAHADYIVSGDRHLLELESYEGIQIVTPARFNAILATASRRD
jgi:putative PIN family toxin of toxin-antitoxin system